MERLFLYGTLLPELAPAVMKKVLGKLVPIGPGRVKGFLYDLKAYPGLILGDPSEGDEVRGKVFEIPDDLDFLRYLDFYEGSDPDRPEESLFLRVQVPVALEGGGETTAWVYTYNRDPRGAPIIAGGDYLNHVRRGRHG